MGEMSRWLCWDTGGKLNPRIVSAYSRKHALRLAFGLFVSGCCAARLP